MAQMAGALHVAVAFVFIGFWALISTFYCQRGGVICETKLPMYELELQ